MAWLSPKLCCEPEYDFRVCLNNTTIIHGYYCVCMAYSSGISRAYAIMSICQITNRGILANAISRNTSPSDDCAFAFGPDGTKKEAAESD